MNDQYTDDRPEQSKSKQRLGSVGKVVGAILIGGAMWFTYTSVLPNIPIVGPMLEATSKPPLTDFGPGNDVGTPQDDMAGLQTDDLLIAGGTPQALDIKDAATHDRLIRDMEAFIGSPLTAFGIDREAFIADSYGWCASIQAYGQDGAYRATEQQVRSIYPDSEVKAQMAFMRAGNSIVERHLCS